MSRAALISMMMLVSATLGCLLELDPGVSCGDGYVDIAADEECDPLVPSSFEGACQDIGRPLGVAACDPVTCQIVKTPEQCARCGDGVIDEGEDCDGDNLGGQACEAGGSLRCTACKFDISACVKCGDGFTDEDEECDYRDSNPEDFTQIKQCVTLDSPYGDELAYGSGVSSECGMDCRWDRSTCSYCGNGRRDDPTPLTFTGGLPSLPEVCDGEDARVSDLEEHCRSECGAPDLVLRCEFSCEDDCRDFVVGEMSDEELRCCRKKGELCPGPDDPFECCWAIDNPGSVESPCTGELSEDQPQGASRCR